MERKSILTMDDYSKIHGEIITEMNNNSKNPLLSRERDDFNICRVVHNGAVYTWVEDNKIEIAEVIDEKESQEFLESISGFGIEFLKLDSDNSREFRGVTLGELFSNPYQSIILNHSDSAIDGLCHRLCNYEIFWNPSDNRFEFHPASLERYETKCLEVKAQARELNKDKGFQKIKKKLLIFRK